MRDDVVQFRFQVTPNRVGNLLEPGRDSNSNFGGRTHVVHPRGSRLPYVSGSGEASGSEQIRRLM